MVDKQKIKNRLKKALLFLLLLPVFVLLSGLLLMHYKPAPSEISVSGTAVEMGQKAGQDKSFWIRQLVKQYLYRGVCGANGQLYEKRCKIAEMYIGKCAPAYRDELSAMANGAGIESNELAYGNSFLDLSDKAAGCRSMILAEPGDNLIHAHNLDWDNLAGLAKWTITITRRQPDDGRFKTVTVGFPGMIGGLDVINEHGLALSFNQYGRGSEGAVEPAFILMRRVAENCRTFEQAREMLFASQNGMPFIITMSAAAENKGAVFQRSKGVIKEYPVADNCICAANGNMADKNSIFIEPLKTASGKGIAKVKYILRHEKVLAGNNLYSLIFDYQNNCLYLASGTVPAAQAEYRIFNLF